MIEIYRFDIIILLNYNIDRDINISYKQKCVILIYLVQYIINTIAKQVYPFLDNFYTYITLKIYSTIYIIYTY